MLLSLNLIVAVLELVMTALPAELESLKLRLKLLVMVALPAVLPLLKFRLPLLVMLALPAVLVSKKFSILVLREDSSCRPCCCY